MGAFGAVVIVAYNPPGLPMAIDTGLEAFGLNGALPYALLLVIAVLPLPILALLWSSRAQGRLGVGAALPRDSVAPVPGRRFGRERMA
jgi:ABC-type sulfate transport system permease component